MKAAQRPSPPHLPASFAPAPRIYQAHPPQALPLDPLAVLLDDVPCEERSSECSPIRTVDLHILHIPMVKAKNGKIMIDHEIFEHSRDNAISISLIHAKLKILPWPLHFCATELLHWPQWALKLKRYSLGVEITLRVPSLDSENHSESVNSSVIRKVNLVMLSLRVKIFLWTLAINQQKYVTFFN